MGWEKTPGRLRSSTQGGLGLLWKHDQHPIYIMDNHMAAMWCWMRHTTNAVRYSLLHLDAHWDSLVATPQELQVLRTSWPRQGLSLTAYEGLRCPTAPQYPLIRWDNYIDPFIRLRPRYNRVHLHVNQGFNTLRVSRFLHRRRKIVVHGQLDDFLALLTSRLDDLEPDAEKFIVNVDLDFFFATIGERKLRAFHDDFISEVFGMIRAGLPNVLAVTIALSPECCGGWRPSLEACRLACEGLGVQECPVRVTANGRGFER